MNRQQRREAIEAEQRERAAAAGPDSEQKQVSGRVERLYEFLKHGDDEHRAWLKEALTAYFNKQPRPEVRGQNS